MEETEVSTQVNHFATCDMPQDLKHYISVMIFQAPNHAFTGLAASS
jgi:hypothetical protein